MDIFRFYFLKSLLTNSFHRLGGQEGDSSAEEVVVDAGGEEDREVKEYTQMSGVNSLQEGATANMSRNAQQMVIK